MKLLKSEIQENCGTKSYSRGRNLFLNDKVIEITEEYNEKDKSICVCGEVQGSLALPYECRADFCIMPDGRLEITDYECDCPFGEEWYGMCKHCIAMCLLYSKQLENKYTDKEIASVIAHRKSDYELSDILNRYSASDISCSAVEPGTLGVEISFNKPNYYSTDKLMSVSIKAGGSHKYVIQSISEFLYSIIHGREYSYGKKLTVCQSPELFDDDSREILKILIDAIQETMPEIVYESYYRMGRDRFIHINNIHAVALMRLCMKRNGYINIDSEMLGIEDGNPPVTIKISSSDGGAVISVPKITMLCQQNPAICIMGEKLYFCTEEFQQKALPFFNGIRATDKYARDKIEKFLSESDFGRFTAYVLPELKRVVQVEENNIDFTQYLPQIPEFVFYLSGTDDGVVTIRVDACYGDVAYNIHTAGNEYRNIKLEAPVVNIVSQYFPNKINEQLNAAVTDDEIFNVLTTGLERLRTLGTVFVDDNLNNLRLAPNTVTNIGVALHGNLIDIEVENEGYSANEINAILGAYRLKKKYYRLKTGEFLSLTDSGLAVVAQLCDDADIELDKSGKAQVPAFRAAYINSVLDHDDLGVELHRNSAFKAQISAIKNYRDEERKIPTSLNATLRGYQKNGYRWLCALSSCSLGGILADDMGLGKTIQMLSYFLSLGGKFLVVCPASLVYNWADECNRFAPSIPCTIMRGTEAERKSELENYSTGLMITSYDRLRRDIEHYAGIIFDCCVLDEAQYIRNAGTKAARAVKQIQANHRFAMTGTPIENRLSDLWSIFDFIMPGYLFKYKDFKSDIEQPVIDGDSAAKQRLTYMTAPFILRRKKSDVLKELPDKQETVIYVEMTGEQRKIYEAQQQALRLTLQKTADSDFLHNKIEYLAALTRLRQICCTPELYLDNYNGGSGKTDACMELLTESAEAGHKTLVFSQFTGMLELLIDKARQVGLKYLYLSGKNTSEQRRDMVRQFQNGEASVFFISLKAGGTGLNLTAADRVLHFDPWWNVAAEQQAADRTHRIGQKNKVIVTKLVCKDTVEERMIDLQNRKRSLSDMVMDAENVGSAALDKDELLRLLNNKG